MSRVALPAGTRVRHRVFGEGTVTGSFTDFDGDQGRVTVEWDSPSSAAVGWWYWDFFGHCELELLLTYGP